MKKFVLLHFFVASFSIVLPFYSCKTKKVPMIPLIEALKQVERTFVIQVCSKFQMSYDGLPCVVYFSDDTKSEYKTGLDGKIIVTIRGAELEIKKVIYNFAGYRERSGQLLATDDYKLATRIPSSQYAKTVVVEEIFSEKTKNLFVLVR